MDYKNEIAACITTININPENIDIERLEQENEKIMDIIKEIKFEGTEQELTDEIICL